MTNASVVNAPPLGSAVKIEPLLATVIESLPVGVVVFDSSLAFVYENDAARCIMPASGDVPAALSRLLVDSRYEDWATNLRSVLGGRVPQRFDGLLIRTDAVLGRYVNILCSSLTSPQPQGGPLGLLLLEDISARISMEQRLAVSERLAAVGKLCAAVAHELNNPLDGILRYLNMALRVAEEHHDPKLSEYLSFARDGTQRMVGIVRELLEFSRNAPPGLVDHNLNKVVEEAVRTLESHAAQNRVAVVCQFERTDMPSVQHGNLFQVFCNLIKNAIDAMPSGGAISICTRADDQEVTVVFADTGTGLPSDQSRLFEPFFTTKPAGQGTGLGLAVSKEIVEKLGGRLTAENRRDMRGAVFTVRLPLRGLNDATGRQRRRVIGPI